MWQSAEFAGAFSLGGAVPEEFGTACGALLFCMGNLSGLSLCARPIA
jgi:hypothetical protein